MELLGVYDADGGLRGEASYVIGKLLGRRHCGLCDVTHSSVRRKPAWDQMVAGLDVPFRLAHTNELTAPEAAAVREHGAPVVLTVEDDEIRLLLDAPRIDRAGGDVEAFRRLLREALADR